MTRRVVDYDEVVDLLEDSKITAIAFPGDGSVRAMSYTVQEWSPLYDEDDPDARARLVAQVIGVTANDDDARI